MKGLMDLERWQEIFENIRRNKMRTFLTGLSVSSGIFILVVLLGIGQGIQNGIAHQFQNDAQNRIDIWPGKTAVAYKGLNKNRRIQFKNWDYSLINAKFENFLGYKSSVYRLWSALATYQNNSGNYRVEGVCPDYQFLNHQTLAEGRYLNRKDIAGANKVVVIGHRAKRDLFGAALAEGKLITIGGINFKVIGVFDDPGGDQREESLAIPLSTAQRLFGKGEPDIASIAFTLPKQANFDQTLKVSEVLTTQIEEQLKKTHQISPEDRSAISFDNSIQKAERFFLMMFTIKSFFWFVGLASLIAGIIGVSNVMLITVKERTKEIGIRKAVGARPRNIIGMVLQEAVFITASAGFLGFLAGMFLLNQISPLIKSDFLRQPSVNFNLALVTVAILILSGALAGFIPARQASRIKPIDALNHP